MPISRRQRDIAVFSTSALDLFASGLGAFILVVFILFPFYLKGGEDVSFEELEDLARQRRAAASEVATQTATISALRREQELLEELYLTELEKYSEIEAETQKLIEATAEIEVPDPVEKKPVEEQPPPQSVATGVEFSILGLATQRKNILMVVDMSGSMLNHKDTVLEAMNDVFAKLDDDYTFGILGYRTQSRGSRELYFKYPETGRGLAPATASNVRDARIFADRMSRNFNGGTPTHKALITALSDYRPAPDVIILFSDGQPTDTSRIEVIVDDITTLNRRKQIQIHTVAIGNYTQEIRLITFLNELARRNNGEFVGRAR